MPRRLKEVEGGNGEIALGGNGLADSRTGYWTELRYPFWIEALNDTFLGRGFENPSFEPTFRFEQVFYNDQITGLEFEDSNVTRLGVFNRSGVWLLIARHCFSTRCAGLPGGRNGNGHR